MKTRQVGFIEPYVFVVFERIGQYTALVNLCHHAFDIDALKGRTTRRQEIDSRSEQVTGTENVTLFEVVASRRQFHQTVEKLSGLPRFERDQLFEIVMAF